MVLTKHINKLYNKHCQLQDIYADVAELADAQDLKSCEG